MRIAHLLNQANTKLLDAQNSSIPQPLHVSALAAIKIKKSIIGSTNLAVQQSLKWMKRVIVAVNNTLMRAARQFKQKKIFGCTKLAVQKSLNGLN